MKRFTETAKWDDPWFLELPMEHKLLWQWLCDRCDNAGVIEPSLKLASFQIGFQYPMDTLSVFGKRLVEIEGGKWFIPKFIPFQYGALSKDCKAHNPVFASLSKNGIDPESLNLKGYPKGIHTLQEKEKEKVKEKERGISQKSTAPVEDLKAYALEIGMTEQDGESMFDHWESNGWKNGNNKVRCWKAGIRKWKANGWLPSQKQQTNGHKKPQQFAGTHEEIPLV
jgi:hypothetical protein